MDLNAPSICEDHAYEGPAVCEVPVWLAARDSSNQKLRVFSWFRLYSPTVLLADICMRRRSLSLAIAISFCRMTVFFSDQCIHCYCIWCIICNCTIQDNFPLWCQR